MGQQPLAEVGEPLVHPVDEAAGVVLAQGVEGVGVLGGFDPEPDGEAEPQRLGALRARLRNYRRELAWPVSPAARAIFADAFDLLSGFAQRRPESIVAVRAELASWALHEADPALAEAAHYHLERLSDLCHARAAGASRPLRIEGLLSPGEVAQLAFLVGDGAFVAESIALAYEEPRFGPGDLGEELWVSPLPSTQSHRLYRLSHDDRGGRHYELLLALGVERLARREETILWMLALGDPPGAHAIVPRFGCTRGERGAFTTAYVTELTAWDKLRQFGGAWAAGTRPAPEAWRNLFVRGLSAFFTAWQESGGRLVAGLVAPTNVAVPDADSRRDVRILSLAGSRPYEGPRSLLAPMWRRFYRQTAGHYPAFRSLLDPDWMLEAAVEGLGAQEATVFLKEALAEEDEALGPPDGRARLAAFLQRLEGAYHPPLALRCAIERYGGWLRSNPKATPAARRQLVDQLLGLYGLERHGELARYHLWRQTYFAAAGEAARAAFDRLLARLFDRPGERATSLVELSELQAALADAEDRRAILDERDVDGEFAVAADEFARAVERVDEGETGRAARRAVTGDGLLGDDGEVRRLAREAGEDRRLGAQIGFRHRAGIVLGGDGAALLEEFELDPARLDREAGEQIGEFLAGRRGVRHRASGRSRRGAPPAMGERGSMPAPTRFSSRAAACIRFAPGANRRRRRVGPATGTP